MNETTDVLLLYALIMKQTSDVLCVNTSGMLSAAVCTALYGLLSEYYVSSSKHLVQVKPD